MKNLCIQSVKMHDSEFGPSYTVLTEYGNATFQNTAELITYKRFQRIIARQLSRHFSCSRKNWPDFVRVLLQNANNDFKIKEGAE